MNHIDYLTQEVKELSKSNAELNRQIKVLVFKFETLENEVRKNIPTINKQNSFIYSKTTPIKDLIFSYRLTNVIKNYYDYDYGTISDLFSLPKNVWKLKNMGEKTKKEIEFILNNTEGYKEYLEEERIKNIEI